MASAWKGTSSRSRSSLRPPAIMMLLAIATVEAYMLPSSSAPVFVSRPAVRSAAVAMEVEAPKKSKGLGFVNGEMRAAAMKLHTRDQAPKEGQQPAQKPVSAWQPGRADYLRFLVDSREVYRCMDDLVATTPAVQRDRLLAGAPRPLSVQHDRLPASPCRRSRAPRHLSACSCRPAVA